MLARKSLPSVGLALLAAVVLAACQAQEIEVTRVVIEKETVVEMIIETVIEKETIVEVVTATPEPEPEADRTLVICLRREPDTLYGFQPFGFGSMVGTEVAAAIYDGPINIRSFGYQPVILEKIPSLEDGDAFFETVTVEAGDVVVDDGGDPVILEEGITVKPAGCYSSDCVAIFDGAPLELEQLVITWKLKPGITWSDGEPLTAQDSVYSFELQRDPDNPLGPAKWLPDRTASYEAVDDYTTIWTSLPGFVGFRGDWFFEPRPEHVWGDLTALELAEADLSTRRPLGWGPYVIDEWVVGDHITLHKNQNYWRADEGLPKFDTLIYRFPGGGTGAAISALLSGECDVLDFTHQLQDEGELLLELQAAGQINAFFVMGQQWEHADFGLWPVEGYERPDFFGDVRTRQAIAHCMDRQGVVDTVLSGQSAVLDTYIVPNHPLHNADVTHYAFDVAQGSALLQEVGWVDDDGDPVTPRIAQGVAGVRNGTPLEFNYLITDSWQRQRAATVFKASLALCGIKINLDINTPGRFFADGPESPVWGRRYDMVQYSWSSDSGCELYTTQQISGDPEALDNNGQALHPNGWNGMNNTGFSNPDFDAACAVFGVPLAGRAEQEQPFLRPSASTPSSCLPSHCTHRSQRPPRVLIWRVSSLTPPTSGICRTLRNGASRNEATARSEHKR